MRPNRGGRRVPPQPGGESFQVFEASPPIYHVPVPRPVTQVRPIPVDDWQVFEAGPPKTPPASKTNEQPPPEPPG